MHPTFGRYELLKRLAGGGMGEVYLARQRGIAGFQKLLVIKTLLPHLCNDDEFIAMFKDEARLSAQLIHPNICQVFEFDQSCGTYYIAMEYLRGEDLRRLWRTCAQKGAPLRVPLICRIVSDAAAGLDFAHSLRDTQGRPYGIVHRDISPQNVLVTFEGGVKIIDFGVAKAAGRAQHTRTGALKGKYGYMSPEQVSGAAIDGRADIFALGIVLHELLTGRRLFKADSEVETLARVRECKVTAPSQLDPRLPAGLDPIVLKALAKDPARRFRTAQEFRLALEDWLIQGRMSASSAHLAEFLKEIFAERLEKEARLGPLLGDPGLTEMPSQLTPSRPTPSEPTRKSEIDVSMIKTESASGPFQRRSATVWAAIGAAVVGVGAVGFFGLRAPARSAPETKAAQLAPVPQERRDPPEKAVPQRVTVVLRTDPEGAEITEGAVVVGTSPHVWSAMRGEHQLSFNLAGYHGVTQPVVAAGDGQEIVVRLTRLQAARRRPPRQQDPGIKAER